MHEIGHAGTRDVREHGPIRIVTVPGTQTMGNMRPTNPFRLALPKTGADQHTTGSAIIP